MSSRHARAAFTLVELLVAIVLITIALVALEMSAASAIRQLATSTRETHARLAAQHRAEKLLATACTAASGVDSATGITLHWTATPSAGALLVTQTTHSRAGNDSLANRYQLAGACP
jgi:prepilin-type N-terminal cleavage/methylation domain-containing protein